MQRPSDLLEDVPQADGHDQITNTLDKPDFTIAGTLSAWDPALRFMRTIMDESRIAVLEDGVFIRAVDAANVALLETWLPKERFVGTYAVRQEGVLAVDYSTLMGTFSMLNSNDLDTMVGMTYDPDATELAVNYTLPMEFVDGTKFSTSFSTIDPASVRQVPEDIGGSVSLPYTAEVNMWALKRFTDHVNDAPVDHLQFKTEGNDVVIGTRGDAADAALELSGQAADTGETPGSLLSNSYVQDVMAGPLSRHQKQTTLSVAFGEEYPVRFAAELPGFENPEGEDGDTAGGGTLLYTQSPRIQSEVN